MPDDPADTDMILHEPPPMVVGTDRSAKALAAASQAAIQARVWLAIQRPRQMPAVRDRILAQVRRPSVAEKAVFRVQRGKVKDDHGHWVDNFAEGLSIRCAEALRIAMGNIGTEDMVIADDHDYRTVMVLAIDYETNSSEARTVVVSKTVERKGYAKGGKEHPPDREILGSRRNSYGDTVYKCVATEAEVQEMQNAAAARARRNCILALVPADLREDVLKAAKEVVTSRAMQQRADNIAKARKFYSSKGVSQSELAEYLGRPIDDATADDLVGLEMLATAIADGHTTWKAAMKARQEVKASEDVDESPAPAANKARKGAAAVAAAVANATEDPPT